jgi:lipopolysaccharide transport system permease protein
LWFDEPLDALIPEEMPVPQRLRALFRYSSDSIPGPLGLLIAQWGLVRLLLRRDIIARTSGTILGGVWLVAQPALQIIGLWFFLHVVLRVRSPTHVPFTEYFLLGMVAWLLISEVLVRSLTIMVEFGPIYQRSIFPLPLLPLLPVLLSGSVYGAVLVVLGGLFGGWVGAVGASGFLIGLGLMLIPLSYLVAVIGLFVREARQVVPFVLTLLMYLTPVMYMPELMPPGLRDWLVLNPLADVMAVLHALVQEMPMEAGSAWRLIGLTAALWPLAWTLFRRTEPHMREAL